MSAIAEKGGVFDMAPLPQLLRHHPKTRFLVDEAFISLAGQSVVHLLPQYPNLLLTRTLSKAHSLAGFRIGYAILPETRAFEPLRSGRGQCAFVVVVAATER